MYSLTNKKSVSPSRPMPKLMPLGLLLLLFSTALGAGLYYGGSVATIISGAGRTVGLDDIQLTIEGNERIASQEIKQALEIEGAINLASFDTTRAYEKLSQMEWVESAEIAIFYPNVMKVKIVEAKVFAIWENAGELYLTKSNGELIKKISKIDYVNARYGDDLYYIKGVGAPVAAQKIIERIKNYQSLFTKVQSYVRVGERRWDLLLTNDIKIMLPQTEIDSALQFLVEADALHNIYERPLAYIDLRLTDRIVMGPSDDVLPDDISGGEKLSAQKLSTQTGDLQ